MTQLYDVGKREVNAARAWGIPGVRVGAGNAVFREVVGMLGGRVRR